jgi:tetratricopeptide (TPR) repeat protein
MPPDETECDNCGAFVIDEAVVRLCRAFGIPREKALALFEKGFRHPNQLQDRNVDDVLERGENGLLFLCTNCGGFVATGDSKCPRCAAEFESEPAEAEPEKDILDTILCPVCGADNESIWKECEICGEPLGGTEEPPGGEPASAPASVDSGPPAETPLEQPVDAPSLDRIDDILEDLDRPGLPKVGPKVRRVARLAQMARARPSTPASSAPAVRMRPRVRFFARPPKSSNVTASRPAPPPSTPMPRTVPRPAPKAQVRPSRPRDAPPRATPKAISKDPPRRTTRGPLPSELLGGLVVAAATSLYLSNLLGQADIAWATSFVVTTLSAYIFATAILRGTDPIRRIDLLPLLAGSGLCAIAPLLPLTLAPLLSAGGAVGLALATRRLVKSNLRDLLVAASGIPLVVSGVVAGLGLAFAGTAAWAFGLLAVMPWPAAVAAEGVRQRRATLVIHTELTKAERHLERADYAQSVKDFDRAIALSGNATSGQEMPWYGKGASLVLLGRYDEALRAIDKALDLNPRNEVAWLNKGNALTKMGRLLDALRCFNAAIKVNPKYEVAWNNKGNTLARLGHLEEALTCYERALQIDPGYRGAWVNKGYVLTKLGRYDEATSCADRALRLNEAARTGTA